MPDKVEKVNFGQIGPPPTQASDMSREEMVLTGECSPIKISPGKHFIGAWKKR